MKFLIETISGRKGYKSFESMNDYITFMTANGEKIKNIMEAELPYSENPNKLSNVTVSDGWEEVDLGCCKDSDTKAKSVCCDGNCKNDVAKFSYSEESKEEPKEPKVEEPKENEEDKKSEELDEGLGDTIKKTLGAAAVAGGLMLGNHVLNADKQAYIDRVNAAIEGELPKVVDVYDLGGHYYFKVEGNEDGKDLVDAEDYADYIREMEDVKAGRYNSSKPNHIEEGCCKHPKEESVNEPQDGEQDKKSGDEMLFELDDENDEFEEYEECSWCGDRLPKSEMKKEKDFGYLCNHCAKGLESREGPLKWEE